MKQRLFLMLLPLFAVACNNVLEDDGYARDEQTTRPTIVVGFEDDTRTYVENNLDLCWHEGDLVSVFYATTLYVERRSGSVNNLYVEVGNKEWSSSGWGLEGGTYYVFDLYSSKSSNNVVPNGTYTLDNTEKANTLSEDNGYMYTMMGYPDMKIYKEATVVVSDEGIDAVVVLSDDSKHHVIYEGKPSF